MSRVNFDRSQRHVDYYMLMEPRPDGTVLGYYAGQPIAAYVVDAHGDRYRYAGVAPRLRNGGYDLEAVRSGEWLVEPGLVYFREPSKRPGFLEKIRAAAQERRP